MNIQLNQEETSKVSVVIITYNRPDEVMSAIESVSKQNYRQTEIVVVDNGSTVPMPIEEIGALPSVKLVRTGVNLGVAGGRNVGIANSSGEVIVFLDDDATFKHGDVLDECIRSLAKDAMLGCVAFRIENGFIKKALAEETPVPYQSNGVPQQAACFVGAGFAVRKDVFDSVGVFNDSLFYGLEELDLSYRMITAGWTLLYWPRCEVLHWKSPKGRLTSARAIEYQTRNRIWTARVFLPFPYKMTYIMGWTGFFALKAMRSLGVESWKAWGRGIYIGLTTHLNRQKLPKPAVGYLRRHHGRLWF